MGKNIITTVLEKLKITDPSRNEKAGYFLMHDAETKEVCAVPEAAILAKVNNRIDGIVYPDGFTKTTEINRVGNTVTIAPLDFEWRIQLNPYTNADEYTKTFDATESSELKRIDTLAATTDGTIVYHKGEEDEFFVKPPRIPTTQLRLSDFSIFGDDVQEHTEPIISEVYTLAEKEKLAILDPTADIDKPVSTAQATADAATLASANSYTDSKVASVYIPKGNKTDYADLVATGEHVIGYVYNLLDSGKNYVWVGSWDDIGGTFDISGKEDKTNKTDDETTSTTSSSNYFSVKGFWLAVLNRLFPNTPAKATTLVDGDLILTGDSVDSFKTKTRTFAQLKTDIKSFFDTLYKNWILGINPITGITYTIGANDNKSIGVFSNTNPVAFTVPTNASVAIPIGTSFEYSVQGAGTVTVGGAGITFIATTLVFKQGNTINLIKIATDTWVVDGNAGTSIPTVTTGEKVLSVTSAGVQANYDLLDPYTGATSVATLDAADWSSGSVAATGVAGERRFGSTYEYVCTGTNNWRRNLNYGMVVKDFSLGDLNDSAGVKTSAQMTTLYPSAVILQIVVGTAGIYQYFGLKGWFYYENKITP